MTNLLKYGILVVVLVVAVLAWGLYFHNDVVVGHSPGFLKGMMAHLGEKKEAVVEEDEDPDNSKNEIPVHVAKISTGTVHRYIEGLGQVMPRPGGSAAIAAPTAGVVSKVVASLNQKVKAGDVLVQLDDRLAVSAEKQAEAALAEAQAGVAALKAQPRPEQVQLAQLAIDKAQSQMDVAQKNYDRQKQLLADQGTAGKNVEQAQGELAAARNEMNVALKNLEVLKKTPLPEDLRQADAKAQQAEAALAAAKTQRQMLAITSPIDGTVVALNVNPGEAVDATKVLVQVVALDKLWVDVDVPVEQLPEEAGGGVGLVAEISPNSGVVKGEGKDAIQAKVTYVSQQVEAKSGAVMVGIDVPADTGGATLRPGQTVRVRIVAAEHKDVLLAPREAVVQDANGDQVISLVEGEQARHQTVKIGLEEGGLIEIMGDKEKVKDGATVVTQGAFGLRETQMTHVKVVE